MASFVPCRCPIGAAQSGFEGGFSQTSLLAVLNNLSDQSS
jgi:hypothetical protein